MPGGGGWTGKGHGAFAGDENGLYLDRGVAYTGVYNYQDSDNGTVILKFVNDQFVNDLSIKIY